FPARTGILGESRGWLTSLQRSRPSTTARKPPQVGRCPPLCRPPNLGTIVGNPANAVLCAAGPVQRSPPVPHHPRKPTMPRSPCFQDFRFVQEATSPAGFLRVGKQVRRVRFEDPT